MEKPERVSMYTELPRTHGIRREDFVPGLPVLSQCSCGVSGDSLALVVREVALPMPCCPAGKCQSARAVFQEPGSVLRGRWLRADELLKQALEPWCPSRGRGSRGFTLGMKRWLQREKERARVGSQAQDVGVNDYQRLPVTLLSSETGFMGMASRSFPPLN